MKKKLSASLIILALVSILFTGFVGQSPASAANSKVNPSNLVLTSLSGNANTKVQTLKSHKSVTALPVKKRTHHPKRTTKSIIVYITRTGRKYHCSWCRYLRQSKIAISLSEAKAEGYTPCKVCDPPQ